MIRGLLVLALLPGCDKPEYDCTRAFARLARIHETKGYPKASASVTRQMIEVCRTGKYASYDPVLRCAMDSSTDQAAAVCIDRGLKEVLTGSGDGRGLNPLVQE